MGKLKNEPAGELVDVTLYSGGPERRILLRVSRKAIVRFRGEPPVQVVTVPYKKTPGVGRFLPDSLSGRVLREEPSALHTDFRA